MTQGIFARLDKVDQWRLKNSAEKAQKLENKWDAMVREYIRSYAIDFFAAKIHDEPLPKFDLETFLTEHMFDVMFESYGVVSREDMKVASLRRLARPPKPVIPKSVADLRKLYDQWRKGQYSPKRPKKIAIKIQKEYLKRINSVWEKHSEDFRTGKSFDQDYVLEKIKKQADIVTSRAQTTVRTETTNYYNDARKEFYDQSPDVVAYLFMAVRDSATTPWCTPKTEGGKRGRHGLVYRKDDPLTDKEKPACHWNCRSEFLPLTMQIPSQRRLIEDESIQRRNVTCHPLPPGWAP